MKKKTLALTLFIILFFTLNLQAVNLAKGYPLGEIPPKVNVPEANVNATISRVNGALWVKIDAEYKMHAVYAFGDSYLAENTGMGLIKDPSPYVTVIVTQDRLEAHYPIPFNATNISVRVDGREVELQQDTHGYFHLFDANLPEINWTVSPVSRDFVVSVHYECPISQTTKAYDYLGDYAFTLPLYGRYGCSNISYPLYSWFGYPPNNFNIQIESHATKTEIFSADAIGTLTPLNFTISMENGVEKIEMTFSQGTENTLGIQGAVVVFNSPVDETELSPIGLIAVISIAIALTVAAALLVYFKKHKCKVV